MFYNSQTDVLDKSDNEAWGKIKVEADIRMSLVPIRGSTEHKEI